MVPTKCIKCEKEFERIEGPTPVTEAPDPKAVGEEGTWGEVR